ncbi:MAG: DMT family transporter [Alphaproteobacteria bacterium]|nr:DMT family transporter [Alphaproteobacteria bacterium]
MTPGRAMLIAVAAYSSQVLYDVYVKLGREAGLSSLAIMAAIGLIGLAAILGTALFKRNLPSLLPRSLWGPVAIGLCSVGVRYGGITCLKYLPLSVFYPIFFSTPLIVAALSALLRLEVLSKTKIACLAAGFAGVLFVLLPNVSGGGEWIGYGAAIVSISLLAVYTILLRKVSQTESVQCIQLFNFLFLFAVGLGGSALQAAPLPAPYVLTFLIPAGLFFLGGNVLFNIALKYTAATNVAQCHYSQIVFGGLIGYWVWGDRPTWNLAVGAALIIVAGLVVAREASKNEAIAKTANTL